MEFTMSDITRIFKRWQWIFWVVVILSTVATVKIYEHLPKEYEVSALLRIEGSSGGTSLGGLGVLVGISSNSGKVEDYIQLMKSRVVLQQVIEKLNLIDVFIDSETKKELMKKGYTKYDFLELVSNSIKNHLNISTIGKSSLLSVSYKSKNPEIAYKIVNAILEEFLDIVSDLSYKSISKKKEFLQNKLSEYESTLKKEFQSYVDFQKKHGIVSLQDELAVRAELLNKLQMEYLKSTLITKSLPRSTSLSKEELSYFQGATENVLSQLISQLVSLETQLVSMREVYSEDNIKVKSLKLQIEDLKKRITALKLSSTEDIKSLTSLYKQDMNKFLDVEPEYFFIQSKLDLLKNMTTYTWQQYIQVMLSEISIISPVTILSKARMTHIPKTLSIKLVGVIGLAIGIFLGTMIVLIIENSSKLVTDYIFYVRELGINEYHVIRRRKISVDIRKLTAKLKDISGTVLIASSNRKDGKSTIAEAFAHSLAKIGKKVLLVDGDSINKTLTKKYNLEVSEKATNGEHKILKTEHLDIMSLGDYEALPNLKKLKELFTKYDVVIVDSPDYNTDPLTVAQLLDISDKTFIIIAEMNSNKVLSKELLNSIPNVHSIIFNKVRWVR